MGVHEDHEGLGAGWCAGAVGPHESDGLQLHFMILMDKIAEIDTARPAAPYYNSRRCLAPPPAAVLARAPVTRKKISKRNTSLRCP